MKCTLILVLSISAHLCVDLFLFFLTYWCSNGTLFFQCLHCRSSQTGNLNSGSVMVQSCGSSVQSIRLPPFSSPLNKHKINQHSTQTNNSNNDYNYNVVFEAVIACMLRRVLFVFPLNVCQVLWIWSRI